MGKAFLNYDKHPITIPKKYYESLVQGQLVNEKGNVTHVKIICPNDRKIDGQIYRGKADYGIFYQITAKGGYPTDYLGHLMKAEIIYVIVEKKGDEVQIHLLDHLEERIKKILDKKEET